MIYLLYILVFLQCHFPIRAFYLSYNNYMNLDCRDNQDRPVDWWYIYKPPKFSGRYLESGGNFTFITSKESGRLQPSRTLLNHNSMVQFTLAPLYKKTLKNSLAVISYGERFSKAAAADLQASSALGILFANSFGGVWISHTIPDFPDLTTGGPLSLTEREYTKGHMLMCLTLNLDTVNRIAGALKHTESKITKFSLPESLISLLPEWSQVESNTKFNGMTTSKTKLFTFSTRNKTLQGKVLARGPDDSRCLYNTFAKMQGIVLDVYNSNHAHQKSVCQPAYSLRYIKKISLKFPEQQVCYIDRRQDRMSFGVSTSASWQRSGRNSHQYWTCTGNYDHQGYLTKGGLIICVHDYSVWFGFDNLKTKEPEC